MMLKKGSKIGKTKHKWLSKVHLKLQKIEKKRNRQRIANKIGRKIKKLEKNMESGD